MHFELSWTVVEPKSCKLVRKSSIFLESHFVDFRGLQRWFRDRVQEHELFIKASRAALPIVLIIRILSLCLCTEDNCFIKCCCFKLCKIDGFYIEATRTCFIKIEETTIKQM